MDALLPRGDEAPQALHRAMRSAVFPGGKRLRPRLLLAVAAACGAGSHDAQENELALNAACAVELVHCASLVHDDLPAFDNAPERRGRPAVHILFGEPLAILAGDALLSCAYEVLAVSPALLMQRAMALVRLLGAAAGSRKGIIGGQSMEQAIPTNDASSGGGGMARAANFTPDIIERYHSMKSASLFRLAAEAGALAAGHVARDAWAQVGHCLGLAFQLADDLSDVHGEAAATGKPVGRDAALGRPNAALVLNPSEVRDRMRALLRKANTLATSLAPESSPLVALFDEISSRFGLAAAQTA